MSGSSSFESAVFDGFYRGAEAVIQDRRASVQPMSTGSSSIDCPEYIRQTVQSWRRQLSRPMNIDLYIFNTTANAHILLERWHFAYSQSNETNLDSFNLLHVSQVKPLVTVQIYDPKITPENFKYESSRYNFPAVVTAKGSVSVSVTFTNPSVVKDILRSMNGGVLVGLPSPATTKASKESRAHSEAIPIPIDHSGRSPSHQMETYRTRIPSDSRDNQHRRSFQIKDVDAQTAALRAEYALAAQSRSFDSRHGGDLPQFYPSSIGSSGPRHLDMPLGTSPGSNLGKILMHGTSGVAPGTSYPTSTSPFGFVPSTDVAGSGGHPGIEIPRASPPYPQISSSLNSASPHLGPSHLIAAMEKRASWKKTNSANSQTFSQLSSSLRTESLATALEHDISKLKIALPSSPFHRSALNTPRSSIDALSTAVAADAHSSNPFGDTVSGDGLLAATSHKLDIVTRFERDRERRNSEVYLYEDRSRSISETTKDEDTIVTDKFSELDIGGDDDGPFGLKTTTHLTNPPTPSATSSHALSAAAPILAILSRSAAKSYPASIMTSSMDTASSGTPLPLLTSDISQRLQDFHQFANLYSQSKNIVLPPRPPSTGLK